MLQYLQALLIFLICPLVHMLTVAQQALTAVTFSLFFLSVRTCFVTSLKRAMQLEAVDPPPDVVYREGGTEIFNIPGKVRESVYEVLFEQDNDQISVSTMILDAIIKARYFYLHLIYNLYQR
jgi:hypothetical protein